MGQRKLAMRLLGAFAGVALLLAIVGIYRVVAYSVGQQTREIGIRAALRALQDHILRLVVGRTLALTLGGVAIGIAGALALTGVMRALLFEVSPTHPATFAAVDFLFTIAGLTRVTSRHTARHGSSRWQRCAEQARFRVRRFAIGS